MSGAMQSGGSGTAMFEAVGRPWYVQFWPLFLVFLMVASIGGSLATVAIAYRNADVDVRTVAPDGGRTDAESPR